jgi:carbamoyltransferase
MDRTLKFKTKMRGKVPAVVHVDGTGRLQSVSKECTPDFYRLIEAFYRKTGVPMLLNTSFNVMGKPILHSVQDAVAIFYTSGLDVLVVEDVVIEKPRRMEKPKRAASTRTAAKKKPGASARA